MIGKYKSLAILGISICCLAAQTPAYGLRPCWRLTTWDNSQADCGKTILVNKHERQVRWSRSNKCEASKAESVPTELIKDQAKYRARSECQIS